MSSVAWQKARDRRGDMDVTGEGVVREKKSASPAYIQEATD
jgi:hypothetical protein